MTQQHATSNPVETLEQLRDLISRSIDTIKQNAIENQDPQLTLDAIQTHPIHNRSDDVVVTALKAVSASADMLRALCDPTAFLNDIIYGTHDLTALFVACQADLANHLGDEPTNIEELSERAGIETDKLARYLRNLCNRHIFVETAPGTFANNQLSVKFKQEAQRAIVGHCADEARVSSCSAWEALILPGYKHSTAINKAPFNIAYKTELDVFTWMAKVRPDIGQRCKMAMAAKGLNLGQYFSLYPWAQEQDATIIDVGGGVGGATLPILREFPILKLRIQDMSDTGPKFKENLISNFSDVGKSGRATFTVHNFFEPQPNNLENGDIYFLRHVIHDWPDSEAIKILSNLSQAMTPASKLLICEHVVFPTYREDTQSGGAIDQDDQKCIAPKPLLSNWGTAFTSRLDLQVLAFLNAKQRTKDDFRYIVENSGLEVVKFWRNMGNEAIIQCGLPSSK